MCAASRAARLVLLRGTLLSDYAFARRLHRLCRLTDLPPRSLLLPPDYLSASPSGRSALPEHDIFFNAQQGPSSARPRSMPGSSSLRSDDCRIFFPEQRPHSQGLLNRWGMVTKEAHDLGTVHITFVGDRVVSFFHDCLAHGSLPSWATFHGCKVSTTIS